MSHPATIEWNLRFRQSTTQSYKHNGTLERLMTVIRTQWRILQSNMSRLQYDFEACLLASIFTKCDILMKQLTLESHPKEL